MRSSDYISISERIRTREINVENKITSVISEISSLESRLSSIRSEIALLETQLYVEKTYHDSDGNTYTKTEIDPAVSARISSLESQASFISIEIGGLYSQKSALESELAIIQGEKVVAIKEIKYVADKKASNYSKAGNMTADYASVVSGLQNRYRHNLNDLATAASILGASIGGVSGMTSAGLRGIRSIGSRKPLNIPKVGGVARLYNTKNTVSRVSAVNNSDLSKNMPINFTPAAVSSKPTVNKTAVPLKKSTPVSVKKVTKTNAVSSKGISPSQPVQSLKSVTPVNCAKSTVPNMKRSKSSSVIDGRLITSVVGEKRRIPTNPKRGYWKGGTPGEGMFVILDDAELHYRGDKMTGAEFKALFGIEGIVYHNYEPDFSRFYQKNAYVDTVVFQDGISYSRKKTHSAALDVLSKKMGKSKKEIQKYMQDNKLTFHELDDRKTVVVIPSWINAVFTHTGAIGLEKIVESLRRSMEIGKPGVSYRLYRNSDKPLSVNSKEVQMAINYTRARIKNIRREIK